MTKSKFQQFVKSPLFWWSLLFLIVASGLNMVSSQVIQHFFPERAKIIDTLFLLTPQIMWTQYLTDIAAIVAPIALLYFILREDSDFLPYYLVTIATGYLLRAFLVLLNPIGGYFGNMDHYGLSNIIQHGMFPSGHTMLVFIAYFLSSGITNKSWRSFFLINALVEIIALVLSRGHYGVDIVGGILVAYLVVNELKIRKSAFRLQPL
jgi:membrane-associated phospholipid phosphatase